MTEKYYKEEMEKLKSKRYAILEDASDHEDDAEYYTTKINEAFEVAKKMANLDSEYIAFIIDQLDKGRR